jgi:hypothetical protein
MVDQRIEYYNGSILMFTGDYFYKFEIESKSWNRFDLSGIKVNPINSYGVCIYKDSLYSIFGWDVALSKDVSSIYKVDLSTGNYKVEEIEIDDTEIGNWSFGYACIDNMMYIFGGASMNEKLTEYYNSLVVYNLESPTIPMAKLSHNMKVPTPRRGHAMEVYNEELYILGGINSNGNK